MKGIIVAAGYGTRFLPVTKTVPKEMLPLINKPSISFIVDEFIQSGITEIVIITSRRKKILDDYFDHEIELESVFKNEGKLDKLKQIQPEKAHISFVRQMDMMGTGHAILQVVPLLGNEPCIVAYPDDLCFSGVPFSKQLIDVYKQTGKCVLSTIYVPGDVSRYGVVDPAQDGINVKGFVEKPEIGKEPSHEVSIGRFLYTPEFYNFLAEGWQKHTKGEYFHAYALNKMIELGKVVYKRVDGKRLDTGAPSGYLEATLEYAWQDESLREVITNFAKNHSL